MLYPIAYASKTLTDAETRYANIEHELLGVVGALEKFHYLTFGREVKILTDHKPLIAISEKSLVNGQPRLQRLVKTEQLQHRVELDPWERDDF